MGVEFKNIIKEGEKMKKSLFADGEEVKIKESGESVTIFKSQYVKNMKRYSYIVNEHPSTFFFEEELTKE
jgi:hypothetical protein